MRPSGFTERGLNNADHRAAGVDDLTVADINSDVTGFPNSQPRNFRNGRNRPLFGCIVVHGIRADVRHPICSIVNFMVIRVEPSVTLNQSHTVSRSATQPMGLDKVCIPADFIGVLFLFCVQETSRQNRAIGSPHITPAFFLGIFCPGDQVKIVFGIGINIAGGGDIHSPNCIHDL